MLNHKNYLLLAHANFQSTHVTQNIGKVTVKMKIICQR